MFLRQTPVGSVKDPATGELQEKHVFVVFYAGERARTKVLKVSSGMGVQAALVSQRQRRAGAPTHA
jgi:V-type H+-transporting ATPase subunit a